MSDNVHARAEQPGRPRVACVSYVVFAVLIFLALIWGG